ncbi:unnamed protein product [marine sediment metagenome]|uniref:Uncharacterized protein n=1 Tax=marine sediment metagenome TaxID=412755 RepID=X1MCM4_9ZZZZ
MERRNERVDLDALKDRVANLENELDMAFRRIKALLSENKELRDGQQKIFDSFVRERSKNTSKEKVAKWRRVNPEGLKKLQNPKAGLTWERVSPQILKMAQNKGDTTTRLITPQEKRTWSLKRLNKFIDILDRIPR